MEIEQRKLLPVLSEALDSVEREVLGATSHHAKRVARLCLLMADELELPEKEKDELAVSALLHDSALNEYRREYENGAPRTDVSGRGHCAAGQENLRMIRGEKASHDFIRYHHERIDGAGPFRKKEEETPLGAQLIHIADEVDRKFRLGQITKEDLPGVREYIEKNEGTAFGALVCRAFLSILSEELTELLSEAVMMEWTPALPKDEGEAELRSVSMLFARIIDYKSPFTKDHSLGLAEKAEIMSRHYGWDEETTKALYCAGALHDIGKLMVDTDVLEKAGKLDEEEYRHIQTHAYETHRLLSKIGGLENIVEWASFHHEKLNGKGYPFGKSAESLDKKARLLACLDIYQALTEDRPYKAGMRHQKAISILRELAEKGELDPDITEDIEKAFHREDEAEEVFAAALFQCPVCGHVYEGDMMPQDYRCPVCGQPDTAFLRIK